MFTVFSLCVCQKIFTGHKYPCIVVWSLCACVCVCAVPKKQQQFLRAILTRCASIAFLQPRAPCVTTRDVKIGMYKDSKLHTYVYSFLRSRLLCFFSFFLVLFVFLSDFCVCVYLFTLFVSIFFVSSSLLPCLFCFCLVLVYSLSSRGIVVFSHVFISVSFCLVLCLFFAVLLCHCLCLLKTLCVSLVCLFVFVHMFYVTLYFHTFLRLTPTCDHSCDINLNNIYMKIR
jgi:hypothetical protein